MVQALDNAEQLVAGSINFVSAARASLLDLDAWRLSTCGAGTDPTTPTSARTEQGMDAFQAAGSDSDGTCDRCVYGVCDCNLLLHDAFAACGMFVRADCLHAGLQVSHC